jgi:hypothetical protein
MENRVEEFIEVKEKLLKKKRARNTFKNGSSNYKELDKEYRVLLDKFVELQEELRTGPTMSEAAAQEYLNRFKRGVKEGGGARKRTKRAKRKNRHSRRN